MNKLITEKKIINKINRDQNFYKANTDILKIHEFDQAPSPVSLRNSSFNDSRFSILPPITTETPSPAATFNITERPATTGALFKDTPQNLLQPATASLTNEAIDNKLGTIEYNSIRGHMVMWLVKYEKKLNQS